MAADKFNDALAGKKIPILILDNKWHKIFGKVNPTPEVVRLESELGELLKLQGKLTNEIKSLKKIKSNLLKEIVDNMDDLSESEKDKKNNKKIDDNKRLVNDTNERIERDEDELMELPRQIDSVNRQLMLATMSMCYERLQDNTEQIEEIAEWITSIRVELKKKIVKKQDMEIYNAELYSYMHDIFGPEVMEIFDMKYIPTFHKIADINNKTEVISDTDSDGNKLVD